MKLNSTILNEIKILVDASKPSITIPTINESGDLVIRTLKVKNSTKEEVHSIENGIIAYHIGIPVYNNETLRTFSLRHPLEQLIDTIMLMHCIGKESVKITSFITPKRNDTTIYAKYGKLNVGLSIVEDEGNEFILLEIMVKQ